jgi:hypothetical protein
MTSSWRRGLLPGVTPVTASWVGIEASKVAQGKSWVVEIPSTRERELLPWRATAPNRNRASDKGRTILDMGYL